MTRQMGRIKDARGRTVSQLDPVKLHLLNMHSVIPAQALRPMADQLFPGARRQRLVQVLSVPLCFGFVIGGTVIYFKYFSTWKGFDPVNMTIYVIQVVVILSGPLLMFRLARAKYVSRVASVMLAHCRCPHCGYDLHGLGSDEADGCTVCPECGCAWRLARPRCS
ncbi:MAG: hypothetical protein ACYTF4_18500 [Planctomycetota bacterium]|jgi:hypothetical protein